MHGSLEAIRVALEKLGTDQVKVRILSAGVGAINESDISLAVASNALMIGFNVRAIPQARDLAKRDGVEIRYHSIIYELIDEVKLTMGGLLSPDTQKNSSAMPRLARYSVSPRLARLPAVWSPKASSSVAAAYACCVTML